MLYETLSMFGNAAMMWKQGAFCSWRPRSLRVAQYRNKMLQNHR